MIKTVAVVLSLSAVTIPPARSTFRELLATEQVPPEPEPFDFDRRLAGMFLAQNAAPSEVVGSSFGWVAYEVQNPFNDFSGLNSRRMLQPQKYVVSHGVPHRAGFHPPAVPDGYVPLATFNLASDLPPRGYTWFTVFGSHDSVIARSQRRFIQLRLFELPAPQPYSPEFGLRAIQTAGTDLQAPPPSGATFLVENGRQPVHLVFTPGFDPAVPAEKTDGVTFQVAAGDAVVYRRHVLPTDRLAPVVLPLSAAADADRFAFSLITTPGPHNDLHYDRAVWRSIKVVIGDAFIDLRHLGDGALVNEWARHNPVARTVIR